MPPIIKFCIHFIHTSLHTNGFPEKNPGIVNQNQWNITSIKLKQIDSDSIHILSSKSNSNKLCLSNSVKHNVMGLVKFVQESDWFKNQTHMNDHGDQFHLSAELKLSPPIGFDWIREFLTIWLTMLL